MAAVVIGKINRGALNWKATHNDGVAITFEDGNDQQTHTEAFIEKAGRSLANPHTLFGSDEVIRNIADNAFQG